jgi:hypothetical protein
MYGNKIQILDTGDNYILALKNEYYQYGLQFYEQMDVTVSEIETDITVTEEVYEFVVTNMGRVLAYGFADTDASIRMNIPDKLIEDLKKTIDFYKVKRFWDNIQFPPKAKVKYDEKMYLDKFASKNENAILSSIMPQETKMCDLYVLYNMIYNLVLVVDFPLNIAEFVKYFPEFVIAIETNSGGIGENIEAFRKLFNQKSFGSLDEIKKKYVAFENLYNIQSVSEKSEKQKVKHFLDWNYIISSDVDKRAKANDLYKEIINFMCIPYEDAAMFKKRLAGYLIEFGVHKKRLSDAYYYYGLERKENSNMTLQQIQEKRKCEMKNLAQ